MTTQNRINSVLTLIAVIAVTLAFAGTADAELINVNFNGFTGGNLQSEVESTLSGPAGGLNTSWNQYADEDSTGIMVDSTGANTSVTFTTDFTEGRTGNTGDLPIFRSTLTDFGREQSRSLDIAGLTADGLYDVWIVAYRGQSSAAERLSGTWSTTNATTSSLSQLLDSTATANGTTFQEGVNYLLFENVEADGSGNIVFNGQGSTGVRLGLSGFQLVAVPSVPEPSTLGLATLGLFSLGFIGWRRRRR